MRTTISTTPRLAWPGHTQLMSLSSASRMGFWPFVHCSVCVSGLCVWGYIPAVLLFCRPLPSLLASLLRCAKNMKIACCWTPWRPYFSSLSCSFSCSSFCSPLVAVFLCAKCCTISCCVVYFVWLYGVVPDSFMILSFSLICPSAASMEWSLIK